MLQMKKPNERSNRSTKPVIPVTNLKERIAALEQKNASTNGSRATSPAPGSNASSAPGGSALKDRIAKFEKKGAVPAPRGRFGLGAPPPPEAQIRRNGELYGNRIPQQVRLASGGSQPPSRSGSSIGFYTPSPDLNSDDIEQRRSFSLNSVVSDLDDDDAPDYIPLTSPTFAFPPNSPESDYPVEGSPTLTNASDVSSFKEPIKRAAPFAQVLEAARKASTNKGSPDHLSDPVTPTPFTQNARTAAAAKTAGETPVPTQLVGSTTPPESLAITEEPESFTDPSPKETMTMPTIVEPAAVAPTIVVESPAQSPLPIQSTSTPGTPEVQVPVVVVKEAGPPPSQSTAAPAQAAELALDSDKPKNRNNKDLTLNVAKLGGTPAPASESASSSTSTDDNATPTSANPPNTAMLSPLPTGASSVFSGSSYGSGGSSLTSPRPFSMIDISLAERVTPATSRGNVVFLPPTTATMPRKSDLVYFPPTPTKDEPQAPATPANAKEAPAAQAAQPVVFNAVVHEKVRETPEPIPHPTSLVPQTPANRSMKAREDKKLKRMTMVAPPTPATGELYSLIQNAVLLENMVENGDLPTEITAREEREKERKQREKERQAAIAADRAKAAAEEVKRKALAEAAAAKEAAEKDKKEKEGKVENEDDFVTNKLRHTFLIPLARARSQHQLHRKEASMSVVDNFDQQSDKSSRKSPRLPKTPEIPDVDIPEVPPIPRPSKSPSIASSKSRFSSFRRLGSVKSVYGRPSMDVSEDNQSIASANPSVDEFGQVGNGHGKESSWPSLSPKKSASGRAVSFAGMFSRSRTKSNTSTLSNGDSSKTHSMYTLPPLPDSLSVIPSVPEYEPTKGPRKSTSLKSLRGMKNKSVPPPMNIPPMPHQVPNTVTVVSPSDAGSPSSMLSSPGPLKSPDYLGFGTMNPATPDDSRPMSWMSVSSLASTLPSPLFEKDIFDSFPAVPSSTPAIPNNLGASRTPSMAATTSFDSAFLSSAIHLAGSRASSAVATPKSRGGTLPR
ncbi:hypothetical protein D9611_008236 [Ephemerocybe angulata]|uniref:Uncharacterized protein n=1 Tax=Ephemerocybe angulata TaxID=980116 RepID=A0A8H5BIL3_9AGAR|nr:hypothetical protein D9611_008236 [Tulosesus angulatus]